MDGLGEDLGLELTSIIGEHTDMGRKIAIDLHEAQGGEAVEPGIGHFLHDLLEALFPDLGNQGLALALFNLRQQMTIDVVRVWITGILRRDPIDQGALRHALDQLTPRPYRILLNGVLIHVVLAISISTRFPEASGKLAHSYARPLSQEAGFVGSL